MSKELKAVTFYAEDVLHALEAFDYELVSKLRAKINSATITIPKRQYNVELEYTETEQL